MSDKNTTLQYINCFFLYSMYYLPSDPILQRLKNSLSTAKCEHLEEAWDGVCNLPSTQDFDIHI